MPTFDTPGPIAATVVVAGAQVRVTASDRTDTVVLVEPIDQASKKDVKVASKTKVDFADGQLSVKTTVSGDKNGSVVITIDLPAGSSLVAYLAHSDVHADGSFGECELHVASGRVQLDRINALQANIAAGEVTIGHIAEHASIDGAAFAMRISEVQHTVKLSSSGGQTWIGHASADLDLSSGHGGFDIDRADGSVTAKTGDGAIRIGRLTRGQAELLNRSGNIEVGISEGTAARVDANSERGSVRNSVPPQENPETVRTTRSRSTPARGTATSSFNAQQTDLNASHVQAASVTSTSSDQPACVPSRAASANRASPRRCRAICSIRATSGWERSGSPRTPALAASSRAACSYWPQRSARSATPTSTFAIRGACPASDAAWQAAARCARASPRSSAR